MKKLFALGIILFGLASCSSDDNSAPAVNFDHLVKKWYPVSYKLGGETVPYDGHEACGKDYVEFLANGTVRNVDVYDCQQEPNVTAGTYTVNESDKTVTLSFPGNTEVRTIKKLNSTTLQTESTFQGNQTIINNYTSTP